MRYVFDIDGTICTPGTPKINRYTGATPIYNRIEKINKLYDEGNTIIYLTARGMSKFKNSPVLAYKEYYKFTLDQLKSWGCKFHELYLGKPAGDYYIDDRAINDKQFFET